MTAPNLTECTECCGEGFIESNDVFGKANICEACNGTGYVDDEPLYDDYPEDAEDAKEMRDE